MLSVHHSPYAGYNIYKTKPPHLNFSKTPVKIYIFQRIVKIYLLYNPRNFIQLLTLDKYKA